MPKVKKRISLALAATSLCAGICVIIWLRSLSGVGLAQRTPEYPKKKDSSAIESGASKPPCSLASFQDKIGANVEQFYVDVDKGELLCKLLWKNSITRVTSGVDGGSMKLGRSLLGFDWFSDGARGDEVYWIVDDKITTITSTVYPSDINWNQVVFDAMNLVESLEGNELNVVMFRAGDFGEMAVSVARSFGSDSGSTGTSENGIELIVFGKSVFGGSFGESATPRVDLTLGRFSEITALQQGLYNTQVYSEENMEHVVPGIAKEVIERLEKMQSSKP